MFNISSTATFSIPKKESNENNDSVLLPKKIDKSFIFAIADGVGKKKGAQIASQIAIEHLDRIHNMNDLSDLKLVFKIIKVKLENIAKKKQLPLSMATTLTLCIISKKSIKIAHTGDCRIYIYKNNKITTLTKDQTEHAKFLEDGIFSEEQLKDHPRNNVLISALSPEKEVEIQEKEISFEPMSIYLMSDGAYDFFEKNKESYRLKMKNTNEFCSKLEKEIKNKGAKDDSSVVAVTIKV